MHLLGNMLGLVFFGTAVERSLGTKQFLILYFASGLASGMLSFAVYAAAGMSRVFLLGASGAVYAVLLVFSVLFPRALIYLWGILPIPAPILVSIFALIEIFSQLFGADSGIAHTTHLFGFAAAWIYVRIRMKKVLSDCGRKLTKNEVTIKLDKKTARFFLLRLLCLLLFLGSFSALYSQNEASYEILRFPLWFPVDNVPSLQKPLEKGDSIYTQAAEELKNLTPFMLEGLIYGWKFTYTPSDKLRGVNEYFSVEAVIPIRSDERLSFTDVRYISEGAKLECWAEYRLSPDMIHRRERYKTSTYRSIHGQGEAP